MNPTHDEKSLRANIRDLKSLRITASLSEDAIKLLASYAVNRKLGTNELLWEAEDPGDFFAIILHGFVEVIRYSKSDEVTTMGVFGCSDVIGLSAVMKKVRFPGSAIALTKDTQVLKLYLRPALQTKSPAVMEIHGWIREMFLLHEQILLDKIDILNAGSAEYRVYELLNHLSKRFGIHENQFRHIIPIKLTRNQIARLVNIRTETVIRLLSKWKKLKLVEWSSGQIVIENLILLEKVIAAKRKT